MPAVIHPFMQNNLNIEGTHRLTAKVMRSAFKIFVELAEKENEGAIDGLLTTITNTASKFSTTITKNVDCLHWGHQESHACGANASHVLSEHLFRARTFGPGLSSTAAATKGRDPGQGELNKFMGGFTVFYLVFTNVWSVLINILSIFTSIKRLKTVVGTGCY